MKCDKLFVYCKTTADTQGLYYAKPEVDEAIAELKADNKLLKERIANGDVSRITWIDNALDLMKENEELKQKLHDLSEHAMDVSGKTTDKEVACTYARMNKSSYTCEIIGHELGQLANIPDDVFAQIPDDDNKKLAEEYRRVMREAL